MTDPLTASPQWMIRNGQRRSDGRVRVAPTSYPFSSSLCRRPAPTARSSGDGASSARSAACSLGRRCRAASKLATISNVVSGPVALGPIGLLGIQATGAMAVVSA